MIEVTITQQQINSKAMSLDDQINGYTHGIKDKLEKYGQAHDDSSVERSVDAIYESFAVMDLLWHSLVKRNRVDKTVAMITSAYVAADYGLSSLRVQRSGKVRSTSQNVFAGTKVDFNRDYPLPLDELLKIYSPSLDRYNGIGLANLTEQYFTWLRDKSMVESKAYPEKDDEFQGISGVIKESYSFRGLTSKVKRGTEKPSKFIWENFGGYHEAVKFLKDLKKIIDRYEDSKSIDTLDDDELLPRGFIVHGPPGTGKTTLMRTFCNEAGIPYTMFSCSEIGDEFVNTGKNDIQAFFDEAAGYLKRGESNFSLLVIDEIDAVGRKRSGSTNGSNEDNKVVTALTTNIDSYLSVDGMIVCGITNLGAVLDPALVRDGRLDQYLEMGYPTHDELKEIFTIYLTKKKGVGDVDVDTIISKHSDLKWTGALVRKVIINAKRKKLIEYLDGNMDYPIDTEDICDQIEAHKKMNLDKNWLT